MNFKSLAIQVLMDHIDGINNSNHAASALDRLAGGNNAFDLNDFVEKFQGTGGDIARKTKSWLGDGANQPISTAQLVQALGADRIAAFARALGIDTAQAADGLAQILPDLIDKSSQGGALLNQLGAKRGLAAFASRWLRKTA